jgi:hypothetical protein
MISQIALKIIGVIGGAAFAFAAVPAAITTIRAGKTIDNHRMGNLHGLHPALHLPDWFARVRFDCDRNLRNRNRVLGDDHLVSLLAQGRMI